MGDAPTTRGDDAVVSAPAPYPRELVGHLALRDGRVLAVRPIRPSDAGALVAFHHRLSEGAVYRRYFSWHPELSADEVSHLTTVDYVDRLALVVEDGDALVAVGRYDRYPGTDRAEVAFLVMDTYQRQGIGTQLLERLAAAARQRGITTFVAETQVDNRDMLSVFNDSGFAVRRSFADGVAYVRFPIEPVAGEPS
ncbi:MAG: GNAT family N-acetyltransferase [Acidobacteriota bacterium]|nr:GNAT family N-acetyltransferase [Acidobacteriota bacterium]